MINPLKKVVCPDFYILSSNVITDKDIDSDHACSATVDSATFCTWTFVHMFPGLVTWSVHMKDLLRGYFFFFWCYCASPGNKALCVKFHEVITEKEGAWGYTQTYTQTFLLGRG